MDVLNHGCIDRRGKLSHDNGVHAAPHYTSNVEQKGVPAMTPSNSSG